MVAKPRRDFAYLNTPKATAPASSAVASTKAPKPWNCALEVVSMAKPPPSTAVAVISGRHRPHKSPKMEKTMRTNAKSPAPKPTRSEEHTSELQSRGHLVCRLRLTKKKHRHHL